MTIAGSTQTKLASALCAAAIAGTCLTIAPAGAEGGPLHPKREQSDNGFAFEFDAEKRDMPTVLSSTSYRNGERDLVAFFTAVGVRRASDGPPLRATFDLRLQAPRAVAYDGYFILKLKDDGKTVRVRRQHRNVVLRPEPGKRDLSLTFKLGAPSGFYEVVGKYVAD